MNKISADADTLVVEYDLFSLPTAQHKAGLAGLLLIIDTLVQRKMEPVPVVEDITATSARIAFTAESLQTLFDDLYDAEWVEVGSKQKWSGKEPKRIDQRPVQENGAEKLEKIFIYDAVQPKGAFISALYTGDSGIWVKLWRDMLWSTLRAIPATRNPFEERAEKKVSTLAAEFWRNLERSRVMQIKGKILTESFSSAIFVGAEDANAEKVPFRGVIENNLLLHFWPIASLIYVPRIASPEKSPEKAWRLKHEDSGYVLTIPEPCDLEEFQDDSKRLFSRLDSKPAGFRPRSAVIDLYEEGGLEYLYHFGKEKISREEELSLSLGAVELYHLQKQGNRVRQLSSERILPTKKLLRDYELLRNESSNPFYKSIRLRNLLAGKNWFEKADQLFHSYPMWIFIYSADKTPKGIRFFGNDVRKQFTFIEGGNMGEDDLDNQLALRIYQLIRTYVNLKTEEKSGKKYKDFQALRDEKKRILYPQEYREARAKVCSDAFLAMRGRRDQDFIEYFTGTICSVPQFMAEVDFVAVAGALMKDWEKTKILSMLALSAHSYLSQPTEKEEGE